MPEPRQYPREVLFSTRTKVYQLGLLGLLCSSILFITGFSSPHWLYVEYRPKGITSQFTGSKTSHVDFWDSDSKEYGLPDDDDFYYVQHHNVGLWNAPCLSSDSACNTGILVAQVAFSFHLAGYIISLLVALYENCKKANPLSYHSRILELCIFTTGIIGTAGMLVFVLWFSSSFIHKGFRWSMVITSLSLTGIYLTFFLIFFGNRKFHVAARGTILLPTQQMANVIYCSSGAPCNTVVQNYQLSNIGNPSYSQAQQNQTYFYPPPHQHGLVPPPYSLPPAYPLPASQPQNFVYPRYPQDELVQASAPPFESSMPQKS